MWWEIDTTGTPVQNGLVDDPTNTIFYTFPSIAVNSENDALMGFGYLSPSVYPSAAYSLHRATDPADSMRPVFVFRHGQKPYYQEFGGTENRWGDYSSTCIDPTNNMDFWTIQESVPNYTGGLANSIWDTWWAHVTLCTAVPGAATAIGIPSVICSGGTATFTTPAVTGATSYTWTISGTGWSGTSTTNTVTATAGTGTATITVTPVNSCGTGAAFTVNTVTPVIAPAVTFSVASHVTTITTADMITYTGSAAPGATYTWNFGGGTGTPGTGAGPQSVVWATTGLKTVTLSVTEGGCTSAVYTDTVLVNALSGVQALNAGYISDASILPNPNNGTFDISFAQPVTTPVSVRVIDLRGHVVYSNDFAAGNSKLTVVTNNLASGTYTVSMLIDGAVSKP